MLSEKLNTLCMSEAPSNFESGIHSILKSFFSDKAEKVEIDCMGNFMAAKNLGPERPIVLTAHCDEVGFIVNYIDESGRIYLRNIGGLDYNILECLRVDIHHNDTIVQGVFCKRSIIPWPDNKVDDLSDLWVDIGCSSLSEASSMVAVGDFATFEARDIICLGKNKELACGKALDNRVGLLVISEVFCNAKCVLPLYACCTVQEEIGCRGAITMSNKLNPTLCVVIDVTYATDVPGINKKKNGNIMLNKGIVIPLGANVNNQIQRKLISIAEKSNIKYQIEALAQSSGTDAKTIQIAINGVDTALISIPCRYMHSPNEIVSMNDINDAIRLLTKFMENVGNPLGH